MTLRDLSAGDFVAFFATDADAAPGTEVDLVATFQVTATTPNNADVGNRVVINDGVSRAAIAACIIQNGVRGIGLLSQGHPSDPASYPVFVAVDWRQFDDNGNPTPPVTIRLRTHANGDAEIVEVDGVAPNPRALLAADQCAGRTRPGAAFEFGARSPEGECTVEYHAFHSERVDEPGFPMTVTPAHAVLIPNRIRGIALDGSFELDPASDGIDPVLEGVTLELSTPGGLFYPVGDVMPVGMRAIPGGWSITDAERARTGVEFFVIRRTAHPTRFRYGFLDGLANLPAGDYSHVRLDLEIGDDQGGVDMALVQRRGVWFLP